MADINRMSAGERIGEALRRSLPHLPTEARAQVEGLINPTTLAIIAGTLAVWLGSHFLGVGEIVDAILLVAGLVLVGLQIFGAAKDLYVFADKSLNARKDSDLTEAGEAFARAVVVLGITAVIAILTKGAAKKAGPRVSPPKGTPVFAKPTVKSVPMGNGYMGVTTKLGDIEINMQLTGKMLQETLAHERVHAFLSPKFWFLRNVRANFGQSAYNRSAFLRYLEEAIAETCAQLRVNGFSGKNLWTGIKFPVAEGYVTITRLGLETGGGIVIGYLTVEGARWVVAHRAAGG